MSPITFRDIKIIDGVCPAIAILFTVTRLALRVQSTKVWWDDALALLSSLCLLLTCTATGMHYNAPYSFTPLTRLAAYYLIAEGFYATLWTARLSILFSIIRISPDRSQRRFLYNTAIVFAVVLAFLLSQVFWVCESLANRAWKTRPNPQCPLGLQVAVCQLVTDIISDALLILIPIRLLVRTNLEPALKIRLLIIFSAVVLTTVVSLVHAAYILEVKGVNAIISAIVEISIALIVCNLVVVVPAISRAFGARPEEPRALGSSFRASSFRFATSVFRFGRSSVTETGTGTEALAYLSGPATSFAASATLEGVTSAGGGAELECPVETSQTDLDKDIGGKGRWDLRAKK